MTKSNGENILELYEQYKAWAKTQPKNIDWFLKELAKPRPDIGDLATLYMNLSRGERETINKTDIALQAFYPAHAGQLHLENLHAAHWHVRLLAVELIREELKL